MTSREVEQLLTNKFVVIIGDSVQRGIYKDIVHLLQSDSLLVERQLKAKGEASHDGDVLIEGGELNNSINYREVRQYLTDYHMIRFYFVTRCFGPYLEDVIDSFKAEPKPDIVIMNSCLWDITRYGPLGMAQYKDNLDTLFSRLRKVLEPSCLVVWNTTLPIASFIRGGFMVREVEYMQATLRLDVLEANFYARQAVIRHNYNVLDLHFHMRQLTSMRCHDGIHWNTSAHRRISRLLLTFIAMSWGKTLPTRIALMSELDLPKSDHKRARESNEERPVKRMRMDMEPRVRHYRSYTAPQQMF